MKPINEMNLPECLDEFVEQRQIELYAFGATWRQELAERIHELTRWIPVEERLPTEADVSDTQDDYYNGKVLWYVEDKAGGKHYVFAKWFLPPDSYYKLISWQRINPPEGV